MATLLTMGVAAAPTDALAGWRRGSAGILSFEPSFRSYSFSWGGAFSLRGSLPNFSGAASASEGNDSVFGAYDELLLPFGSNGSLAVRYLTAFDGFIFERRVSTGTLPP